MQHYFTLDGATVRIQGLGALGRIRTERVLLLFASSLFARLSFRLSSSLMVWPLLETEFWALSVGANLVWLRLF